MSSAFSTNGHPERIQPQFRMKLIVALVGICVAGSAQVVVGQEGRRGGEGRLVRLGIVGDGQTDDSASIQRAIDDGIGSLSVPKGVFRLSKTVVIDLDKTGFTSITGDGTARFVMAGPGPAFKFVGTLGGNASPGQIKAEVWDRQRAPQVTGIEILGEHPEAEGIEATGVMQLIISRVVIRKTLHAIHLTNRNRNVILEACHLYDNAG